MKTLVPAALAALLLAAPAWAHTPTFTDADNGRHVFVHGRIFTLRLTENLTTGYHWRWRDPSPAGALRLVVNRSETPAQPPGAPPHVGVGGVRVMTVELRARRATVVVDKLPPGRPTPAETYTLRVSRR